MQDSNSSNSGVTVMDATKKPPGFNAFHRAVRAIVQVPKADVDAKMAADKAARLKTRRKKKK